MKERGDSFLKQTQNMCQIVLKHVLCMTAKRSTLEIKHFVKERRDPLLNHDDSSHEQIMVNEANMDFRIPGLPHSVVKHAQSTSVRELVKKIENHLTNILFNAIFSKKQSPQPDQYDVKENDSRIVWIARDGSPNAVHSMLIILECRHSLLHMRAFLAERNWGQSKIRKILTLGLEFLMDQTSLWWIWTTMSREIPEVQLG